MLGNRGKNATARTAVAGVLLTAACTWEPNLPPEIADDTPAAPDVRVPDPVVIAAPGQSQNVLQHYAARDEDPQAASHRIPTGPELEAEAASWSLPFKSKRMVAALMTTVARDRLDDLPFIVARDARWGLPDPRMLQARPIFDGDDGERFFAALRRAAERFPHPASYVNATEFAMGIQERLRSGAEPMWAYYENEFDRILFRLRIVGGHAWIDYVGVFDAAPTAPVHVQGKGVPPSMSPPALRPDGSVTPTLRQGAARPQPRRPPPG